MRHRFAILACLFIAPTLALSADWPQWRGPNRDDISKETGLLKTWPANGPKLLWTVEDCGAGYSGIAVVGDVLYSMGAEDPESGNKEFVFARSVKDGKELWRTNIGTFFSNKPWGGGPRATPTVDGDMIYVLGGTGVIACLKTDGKLVWSKTMQKDLAGKMMSGWGYCESPLIDGDRVICSPGGDKGTIAALDKKSGDVIWRSKGMTDPAAYSSIVIANIGGIKQYIQMTKNGVIGVKAEDGSLLWSSQMAKNGTAVIPTPVFKGDQVFVTSGYGAGCGLVKVASDGNGGLKAEDVYDNKDMSNHHGGVILLGDHVYGHSDRKGWVCMEFATGKVVWSSNKLPKGSITYADGSFFCYSETDGTLVKVEATPTDWKEQGRFKLPKLSSIRDKNSKVWTHPTIANGRLYLRDQGLLYCYDIRNNES